MWLLLIGLLPLSGCTTALQSVGDEQPIYTLAPAMEDFFASFITVDNRYGLLLYKRVRNFTRSGHIFIKNLSTKKACKGSFVLVDETGYFDEWFARGTFRRSCLATVFHAPLPLVTWIYFRIIWWPNGLTDLQFTLRQGGDVLYEVDLK